MNIMCMTCILTDLLSFLSHQHYAHQTPLPKSMLGNQKQHKVSSKYLEQVLSDNYKNWNLNESLLRLGFISFLLLGGKYGEGCYNEVNLAMLYHRQ